MVFARNVRQYRVPQNTIIPCAALPSHKQVVLLLSNKCHSMRNVYGIRSRQVCNICRHALCVWIYIQYMFGWCRHIRSLKLDASISVGQWNTPSKTENRTKSRVELWCSVVPPERCAHRGTKMMEANSIWTYIFQHRALGCVYIYIYLWFRCAQITWSVGVYSQYLLTGMVPLLFRVIGDRHIGRESACERERPQTYLHTHTLWRAARGLMCEQVTRAHRVKTIQIK